MSVTNVVVVDKGLHTKLVTYVASMVTSLKHITNGF